MWKVRELADKVTNVVMNYTEIESKVREATNDDPWGPTGTIKHELSQATFSYDQFPEVMGMLWKRIAENKRSPRRIYKSLLLLHHLLLHGSERVVRAAQDRLYEVRSLQDYHVVYEPGFNFDAIIPPSGTETKDGELNVRVKAKELVELIQDEERLREERKKAKKNRDKYVGIGSDKMMTSKWSDNDFGGGYDEEYGRKSRSPSPPTKSKFKPYSDSEADLKRSPNSFSSGSNRSFTSKPAPPSPGVEVSDDFDPRSDEKVADFGDFTSAPTNAATSSFKIGTPKESGGDFADFQSAFADSPPTSIGNSAAVLNGVPPSSSTTSVPAATAAKSDDLLGLSFDIGGSSAATSSSTASLLTDSLFSNSAAQQPNFPVTNSVSFPNFAGAAVTSPPLQSPTMQFQAAFPSMGSGGFSPTSTPAVPSQPQSLPVSQPFSSPSGNFGGDLLTPILEPAKPSANGSIANNSNNNNNNSAKPSLQGTTWSDLNISIDDLNLGRDNGRNGTANKTPMNQLKASNTANSFGGLGGFP